MTDQIKKALVYMSSVVDGDDMMVRVLLVDMFQRRRQSPLSVLLGAWLLV